MILNTQFKLANEILLYSNPHSSPLSPNLSFELCLTQILRWTLEISEISQIVRSKLAWLLTYTLQNPISWSLVKLDIYVKFEENPSGISWDFKFSRMAGIDEQLEKIMLLVLVDATTEIQRWQFLIFKWLSHYYVQAVSEQRAVITLVTVGYAKLTSYMLSVHS